VTAECWRVLKPSGSLFLNLGDKYAGSGGHNNGGIAKPDKKRKGWDEANNPLATTANATRRQSPDRYNQASDGIRAKSLMGLPWRYAIGCIDGQADPEGKGWILRSEIVWSKPNGLPESVRDRVRRSHEQWFHFTKEPRYYADMDVVREPHADVSLARSQRARLAPDLSQQGVGSPNTLDPEQACNPLGKLPGSVWTIPTQPLVVPESLGVDHFAAFPTEWPRRIITAWSPSGGVVLDPFGGTGTTAMVAKALGRYGVSLDLSADYLRLAHWRINESDHVARVQAKQAGRTYRPAKPEADGQASIFDLEATA
jgi:site-specific DNA-methyltransferase (cytosine-N4-specific)